MSTTRRILLVALAIAVMAGPAVFVAVRSRSGSASFTATERVGRNELTAARLDLVVGSRSVPLIGADLAPGDVRSGSIEFVNGGTTPLRYSVRGAEIDDPAGVSLAPWLRWRLGWADPGADCPAELSEDRVVVELSGDELAAGTFLVGDPRSGDDPGDRTLDVGERDLLCIEVDFDVDAPNDVQAMTLAQPIVAEAEQSEVRIGGQG